MIHNRPNYAETHVIPNRSGMGLGACHSLGVGEMGEDTRRGDNIQTVLMQDAGKRKSVQEEVGGCHKILAVSGGMRGTAQRMCG